jgi:hypothetical protein
MQANSIHPVIDRVRRAMPRNMDVMAICDRCEELERVAVKPKFDKRAYQRELMRKRRATKIV